VIKLIKKYSAKIGIDVAIAYTILSRFIQAGGGVITLLFVAKYLSKVEQGYYYTFGSILAIQIFFELGLSNIITQFVAHETSNIKWQDRISFSGSKESGSRISSLLRFTVKWFVVIAVLLLIGLLIAGYAFFGKFSKGDNFVNWEIPWVILSIMTSLSLMLSPILAFFEGLGRIKEVAKIRLVQQTVQLFLVLLFFSLGFKLFSSPLAAILSFGIVPLWILLGDKKKLLIFIWHKIDVFTVNYREEIFPFQWKIALSWISGYFIFQLFNPILFATEGAIVAGQMGMTLTVLSGVLSISMSWINTKIPLFSSLIAKKDFNNLDLIFNKTLKQACFISSLGLIVLVFSVLLMRYFNVSLANRFLSPFYLSLLCLSTFVNQIVSGFAIYLRCHKKEPFLVVSIVMGILTASSTIILGKYFGIDGIVIGYTFLTVFVSLFWGASIFIKKRKIWHQ
jgi:O-antigen/teichoic acid export membrane protein